MFVTYTFVICSIKLLTYLGTQVFRVIVWSTNFMVFPSGKSNGITVLINGHQIAQVDNSKYLGLYIDDDLNWKNHIEYIYGKLLTLVGIFYKIRNKLPLAVLKTIYFAFVHSHILYGIELYAVLKLSRNAPERHTGTFWKGGTPYRNFWRRSRRTAAAFRLRLDTARLTASCRLQVYRRSLSCGNCQSTLKLHLQSYEAVLRQGCRSGS